MCSNQYKLEPTHAFSNVCPNLLTENSECDSNSKGLDPRRVESNYLKKLVVTFLCLLLTF